MIESLFEIKKIKLKKAEMAAVKKRQEIEKISNELAKLNRKILDYKQWRLAEEKRLFEDAKLNFLNLKQLEEIQQQLLVFLEEETKIKNEVEDKEEQIKNEKDELDVLNKNVHFANKGIEKIKYIKSNQIL